jgi:WD40 repeat protein/transcriptional regulator with XRE-family HTH domain
MSWPDGESFHGLLLRYRGRTGLTQRELAVRLGVHMRSVQAWEAGANWPSVTRLEGLTVALLDTGGLTPGREAAEAEALWSAARRDARRLHAPFDEGWFADVLAKRGSAPAPAAVVRAEPVATDPAPAEATNVRRQDWNEAPDVLGFVGREAELDTLRGWVLDERCRLIGVLGMGGIGKTSVAARLAQDVAPAFQRVYWRGLRNAPSLNEWMTGAISFLSGQRSAPPDGEMARLTELLHLMNEQPCLLILDNFETVLEPGQREGRYRDGFAGYGAVLQAVGETRHQSCVVVTSREAPSELTVLGGQAVRTLELDGLGVPEGQVLLANKRLTGSDADWDNLVSRFGGNGLALKLVGESIRQVFGGDIGVFLAESGSAVFGGIRRLLAEQIDRSSAFEQNLLRVLAIEREPVTLAQLMADVAPRLGRGAVLEALMALLRRSLVERVEADAVAAFTLQSVVLEYMTDRLVEEVSVEILDGQPVQLVTRPLVKAQAKEYIRHSQERLVGEPVLQSLNAASGPERADELLLALLDGWRGRPRAEHGYGPGNVVNLLRLSRGDLRRLNLAGLGLRQAYLAGVEAQDTSLVDAQLTESVLTEAFNFAIAVDLSRDGTCLVAGTSAGEVWLWRVSDRTPLFGVQAHTGPVHGVALSSDGRLLASASEDGTLRLWEVPDGRPLATLYGHTGPVHGVALSGDGRLLVSGGFDGTIRAWDTGLAISGGNGPVAERGDASADRAPDEQKPLATFEGPAGGVWSVALSDDGRLLASGSFDGTLRLWEPSSGQPKAILEGHDGPVWSVRLTPDGRVLASGGEDARVRRWDATSGRLLETLEGHTGAVRSVALSADGRLLASGSWDRTIRLWELPGGRPLGTLDAHTGPVRGVALSATGRMLASGSLDGSVRLWETPGGQPLASLEGHTSPVYGVALSADGSLLAGGSWDGAVRLWATRTGELLATLHGHSSPVYGVALSADGTLLASGSWDRTARLWSTSRLPGEARPRARLLGHTGGVRSVAVSADGQLVASGSWDGTVRLWGSNHGRLLHTLTGHTGGVRCVALSADGQLVASGSLDGTVRLWDTTDGQPLATLDVNANPVYGVALSADGRLLASASWDGLVHLWDARNGRLLETLRGHSGEVRGVALSADGRLLASAGLDRTVRLWEAPGGKALATFEGHASPVYGVALSADGRLLASGSFDGTLRVWDARSGLSQGTIRSDRPYERMEITGLTGVTTAQRAALLALGAIEHRMPSHRG